MSDDGHLTHGWEPDLPAGDSLLRAYLLTAAAHSAALAALTPGGRAQRWPDLAAADPASPVLFDNLAVRLQPPQYAAAGDVGERLDRFYPPARHATLLSAWPTPPPGPGWELMGHPPLMLRPPGGTPPPAPAGLAIRPVTDAAGLAAFVATLVAAYPMPAAADTVLADAAVLAADIRLYVGYVDGTPVGTAGARLGAGVTDVEWVAVLPAYRGRGIGAALTWAATAADPAVPAMLIASDDGQPIYRALGYLPLLRLTMWHRPPR
ncbi:hypothetical protein GCM10010123_00900 [Pilimelia anulata]|uniref:N-acetyltransferase domain-containing protein n=1 Tax=Pilimelia anulata TaxID=53371 RepID=A0A8J3B124_9ACTN|nr:GNAT family N-acetyltransferase [Pilimelia anulata]GGJ74766.1 hypothetical protein GCM10010123_00900 [Pilimelia anulata]